MRPIRNLFRPTPEDVARLASCRVLLFDTVTAENPYPSGLWETECRRSNRPHVVADEGSDLKVVADWSWTGKVLNERQESQLREIASRRDFAGTFGKGYGRVYRGLSFDARGIGRGHCRKVAFLIAEALRGMVESGECDGR